MTFAVYYSLMTMDQASPREIAKWLRHPSFAAHVREQRSCSA